MKKKQKEKKFKKGKNNRKKTKYPFQVMNSYTWM